MKESEADDNKATSHERKAQVLFGELLTVMRTLRGEGGCPWDRKQHHQTLRSYLIEETYEVVEAIDRRDDASLTEELGDLLLQIVFHALIAEEEGRFRMDDILTSIIGKLKRRHPHVYGDREVTDIKEVLKNWEDIKRKEKRSEKGKSVLDGLPGSLPALLKAKRIQEKVSRVGFDWNDVKGALEKVEEEWGEFKEALQAEDIAQIEDELGDLLFAVANVARFLERCPEDALRKTIDKFERRFRYIEHELEKRHCNLDEASLEEMDELWEEYKRKKGKR